MARYQVLLLNGGASFPHFLMGDICIWGHLEMFLLLKEKHRCFFFNEDNMNFRNTLALSQFHGEHEIVWVWVTLNF